MQETRVRPLAWKDPSEQGMATHSSLPAWEMLQSMGSQSWTWLSTHAHSKSLENRQSIFPAFPSSSCPQDLEWHIEHRVALTNVWWNWVLGIESMNKCYRGSHVFHLFYTSLSFSFLKIMTVAQLFVFPTSWTSNPVSQSKVSIWKLCLFNQDEACPSLLCTITVQYSDPQPFGPRDGLHGR